jgi:thiol-disulfide isomerase/thioredoxin
MKPWLVIVSVAILVYVLSPLRSFAADGQGPAAAIMLESLKWTQLQERLASNKKAKFTLVDAWATTCAPCKENFPHLVEMHRKYANKGLAVISLSLDDPSDAKAITAAERFLIEKKAVFTNVLLDENYGDGFEKLDINAIPAVFIFGPDGKEVKRFTMDDPNHQFTYEQVEKEVVALLEGRSSAESGK